MRSYAKYRYSLKQSNPSVWRLAVIPVFVEKTQSHWCVQGHPVRHKWKRQTAWVGHPWWGQGYKNGLLHFNLGNFLKSSSLLLDFNLMIKERTFSYYFRSEVSFFLCCTEKKTQVLICPNGKQRKCYPPRSLRLQSEWKDFTETVKQNKKSYPIGFTKYLLATGLKISIWNSSCLGMLPDLESVLGLWTVSLLGPYSVLWHL